MKTRTNNEYRTTIINKLANKIQAKKYLEIGVRKHSLNYDKINIPHKTGVDPDLEKQFNRDPTYKLTSDEFFAINHDKFDIIFIDGLHEADQVKQDIINSLNVLNEGGFIVCHDMNPIVYERQLLKNDPKRLQYISKEKEKNKPGWGMWNGDCWKAWVHIRNTHKELKMYVIDADQGVGIMQRGTTDLLDLNGLELTYDNLDANRKRWLNLISTDEFNSML